MNDKGWNPAIFVNGNKMGAFLCEHCRSVCRDCSELGCNHDDDEIIHSYCLQCLESLVQQNGGKCPINQHSEPVIIPNRSNRGKILKATVYCPFSVSYKSRVRAKQNVNGDVMDTLGDVDEKEGVIEKDNKSGCEWCGTLKELIHSDHLEQCSLKYDPLLVANVIIAELKAENADLKQSVIAQKVCSPRLQHAI